jgi:maltokinase
VTDPVSALLGPLGEWLPRQRWFAAKGRSIAELSVAQSATLRSAEPRAELLVLAVEFDDGGPTEYYQLLLGLRSSMPEVLRHVTIGMANGLTGYDGLWDPELSGELLALLAEGASRQWLRFVPEPDVHIPTGLSPRVLSAEQSNTSVVFGDELMFKLFRRVAPGVNPDLELHRALHSVHSQEVAGLRAAVEGTLGGEPAVFGMMQEFAANSAEGWSMALLSIRDLFAEADLRADEVGGDFAGDAFRLGKTVAVMHAELAKALGSGTMSARSLADGMRQRLDRALPVVPELGELADELRAAFDTVVDLRELAIQRIHGDLHLGQTLRTPRGWLLIDFEGEPARPLAQRRTMEPALRDVAGMLRSFDYAAYHQLAEWGEWANPGDAEPDAQLVWHAEEWATRNREAFCDGYAGAAEEDPRACGALLRALELDKAVYETVYETRNRPGWLQVPLRSMRRLLTASNRP